MSSKFITNMDIKTVVRKVADDVEIKGIVLGERGRGHHETFLPVPKEFPEEVDRCEILEGFAMGTTKSSRPRIVLGRNDWTGVCLVVSSNSEHGGKAGSGYIKVLKGSKVRYAATGEGSCGTDACIQLQSGWVQVFKATGTEYFGYVPDGNFQAYSCLDDLIATFDFNGWELPFKLDPEERQIVKDEWQEVMDAVNVTSDPKVINRPSGRIAPTFELESAVKKEVRHGDY